MKKSILSAASAVMLAGQLLSAPATFAGTVDTDGAEYWYNPENAAFSQEVDIEIDAACLPYTVEMQYINCATSKRINYLDEYGHRFDAVIQLNNSPITLTSINLSRNTFYLYFSGKNKTSNLRNATLDEFYVYWVDDDMPSAYSQTYAKEYTEIIRNGTAAESGIHLLIYQPTPDIDGYRQLNTRKETRFIIPDGKDNLIDNIKNALYYTYVDSYGNLSYGTLNYAPCVSSESYGDGLGVECASGFRFINSTYGAFFVPTEERDIDKDLPLITPEEVPSDDYFEEGIEPGWPFDFELDGEWAEDPGTDDEWIDNPTPDDEWMDNLGVDDEWIEDSEPDDTWVDDPVFDESNPENDETYTSDPEDPSDSDTMPDASDGDSVVGVMETDDSPDDGATTDDIGIDKLSGSDTMVDDLSTDDLSGDPFATDNSGTNESPSSDTVTDDLIDNESLSSDDISDETPTAEPILAEDSLVDEAVTQEAAPDESIADLATDIPTDESAVNTDTAIDVNVDTDTISSEALAGVPIGILSDGLTDGLGLIDVSSEELGVSHDSDGMSDLVARVTLKSDDNTPLKNTLLLATAASPNSSSSTPSGSSGNSPTDIKNTTAVNEGNDKQVVQAFEKESENSTILQDYHASPVSDFIKNNRNSRWAIIMVVIFSIIFFFWWFFPIRRRKKDEEGQK